MTKLNKYSLLETLLSRGDHIDIIKGKLVITSASKKPIPKNWLADNSTRLLVEVATLFDINVYIYDSYSTGYYGKHKSAGMTLQLTNIATGEESYVIYNVELVRSRNSAAGSKGDPLPKGQFRLSKKHKFYKFWLSTGLKIAPRLSSYHDYMGNLKQLFFMPRLTNGNKIKDKLIPLLSLSHKEIIEKFSQSHAYKIKATAIQAPYNPQTTTPYNDSDTSFNSYGLQVNKTTCEAKHGLRFQGSADIREGLATGTPRKRAEDQTAEEWLNDYINA